jgi:hypothetical protein
VHPARVQHVDPALAQPRQPSLQVTTVGPPGAGRAQAGQPCGGQHLLALAERGHRGQLGADPGKQFPSDRRRRRLAAGKVRRPGPMHRREGRSRPGMLIDDHGRDDNGGHRHRPGDTAGYHPFSSERTRRAA